MNNAENPNPRKMKVWIVGVCALLVFSLLADRFLTPKFWAYMKERQSKAIQKDMAALFDAVIRARDDKNGEFPQDIHKDLISLPHSPIKEVIKDPYETDASTGTYGYVKGVLPNGFKYFVVYTKGPSGDTDAPKWDATRNAFVYRGSGSATTNGALYFDPGYPDGKRPPPPDNMKFLAAPAAKPTPQVAPSTRPKVGKVKEAKK